MMQHNSASASDSWRLISAATSSNHNFDIIIYVEGKAFPASREVLCRHSGYFRTVLGPTSTSLSLPSVPAEYFGILLASLYTNCMTLGLSDDNVYQVMLYGQLLQMPAVVLKCNAYIANMSNSESKEEKKADSEDETGQKIVRPIPNKPTSTALPLLRPPAFPRLDNPLWKPWQTLYYSASLYQDWMAKIRASLTSAGSMASAKLDDPIAVQSTTGGDNFFANSQPSISVKISKANKKRRKRKSEDFIVVVQDDDKRSNLGSRSSGMVNAGEDKQLDTAACDGPVRFHRIVNPVLVSSEDEEAEDEDHQVDVVGGEHGPSGTDGPMGCTTGSGGSKSSSSSSDVTYQCLFCNHIFKSHYCYQKHKRRHLNPFTVDFTITTQQDQQDEKRQPRTLISAASTSAVTTGTAGPRTASDSSAKVLKDINVQFFPCKICGAKFPSYYFVHKHKKIWHADHVEVTSPSLVSPTSTASMLTSVMTPASNPISSTSLPTAV